MRGLLLMILLWVRSRAARDRARARGCGCGWTAPSAVPLATASARSATGGAYAPVRLVLLLL